MCLSATGMCEKHKSGRRRGKGMSFANKLKQQLLNLRYDELRQLRARTHGLLRFSKRLGRRKCCCRRKIRMWPSSMPTVFSA